MTYATKTDVDGNFTLDAVPAGTHQMAVTKGSFAASVEVVVEPDKTTTLAYVCVAPKKPLLVVTGMFDSIQDVLKGLGYKIRYCEYGTEDPACPAGVDNTGNIALYDGAQTTYITNLLLDGVELGKYAVIFLNCGIADYLLSAPQDAVSNLQRFVENGGSLYVSDWAYGVLEKYFNIPPQGGPAIAFYQDSQVPPSAKAGVAGTVAASVTDSALAAALEKTSVQLLYDKDSWAVLAPSQPAGVAVWVKGGVQADPDHSAGTPAVSLTDAPLLVSVPYGQGRIVFTTFHNSPNHNADIEAILRHLVFEL